MLAHLEFVIFTFICPIFLLEYRFLLSLVYYLDWIFFHMPGCRFW